MKKEKGTDFVSIWNKRYKECKLENCTPSEPDKGTCVENTQIDRDHTGESPGLINMNSMNNLAKVMQRENNNFDLIRILAAFAVIYGHSFALLPNAKLNDFLYRLIGIYSAEWGVKTFFFLSGLYVVNSVKSGEGAIAFLIKRFFRIWPALVLVVSASAFVIGPLCTTLRIGDYFANAQVYHYVINMSLFKMWGTQSIGYYNLPGVFAENTFKYNVNAPLWTMAVMVFAYLMILSLSVIGAFNKRFAIILFCAILLDTFLQTKFLFFWLPINSNDFTAIPFCFALGGLLAIYKEKITINAAVIFGFYPYVLLCIVLSFLMGYLFLILIEKRANRFGRFLISRLPAKVADFGRQTS